MRDFAGKAAASLLSIIAAAGCGSPHDTTPSTTSSYYWNNGVLPSNPSVCWVDDAATARPAETAAIQATVREWEWASGLRFNWIGNCAAPTSASGRDTFPGTIRILLQDGAWPAGGKDIPGQGCLDENGAQRHDDGPLWSNPPTDSNKSCKYTMHLTAGEARNNYLHEFGHGIGLQHEHERPDTECQPDDTGTNSGGTYITSYYDRLSVMHYVVDRPNCQIPGNWGNTGLSAGDQLAAEFMYPSSLSTRIYGATVVESGKPLSVMSDWEARGANIQTGNPTASLMRNFRWSIDGVLKSTDKRLVATLAAGAHVMRAQYTDHLGHTFDGTSKVEVLPRAKIVARLAAANGI